MTNRAAWRWCAVAGIAAALCAWLLGRIPGLVACGPTGGLGPILAFELARTPAEVAALFGSEPCRTTLATAQQNALLIDGLGFIPGYTAFLVLAALALRPPRQWRNALIAALFVAGLCDETEGGLLYAILRDLPGTPTLMGALWWVVHIKFALLGLGTLALAVALGLCRRIVPLLFGAVVCGGAAEALHGFAILPNPTMMQGFALAWGALLVTALVGSFAASLFAPAPARAPQAPAAPIR